MNALAHYRNGMSLADKLFDDFGDVFFGRDFDAYDKQLRVHTEEEDDKYIIMAEVPGLTEDQLNIEYKDNILSVSAQYEEKDEGDNYKSLRRGRYAWSATARNIDAENISASLENGVLKIELPKSPEAQPRKIDIKSSKSKK